MLKSRFEKMKQNIASLLVVILLLQSMLSMVSFGALRDSGKASEPRQGNVVELNTGSRDGFFEYIRSEVGGTVTGDGDKLSLNFYFALDEEGQLKLLEEYLDSGKLVFIYEFLNSAEYEDLKAEYNGSYDAYLEGMQEKGKIKLPSFTCTVKEGVIDVDAVQAWLLEGDNKNLVTGEGKKIGICTLKNTSDGPQFTILLDAIILNRTEVVAGFGADMQLLEKYDQGTTVTAKEGAGQVDLDIKVNGVGTPLVTNSNYSIEKELESNDMDAGEGYQYRITATATGSNMTTVGKAATNSNIATNSVAAPYGFDEEETKEDAWEQELMNDLHLEALSVPMKSNRAWDYETLQNLMAEGEDLATLNGYWVRDSLPEGLVLKGVKISINGSSFEPLEEWEDYYDTDNGLFSYEIDFADPVFSCEMLVVADLSRELWQTYYNNAGLENEFVNQALLKDPQGNKTVAISKPVATAIDWGSFIAKEGEAADVSDREFTWTITTEGHFSPGVELYLVDHISDIENTHNHVWDENATAPLEIGYRGKTPSETSVTKLTQAEIEASGLSVEELQYNNRTGTPSIDTIETLLTHLGKYNDGNHYAYEYTYENDGTEITDVIMLVSMKNHANGTAEVRYNTEVTAPMDTTTGEFAAEIANEVKAIWKWQPGDGPGDGSWGSIDVEKRTKIQANVVEKKAGEYHAADDTIDWEFLINESGRVLDAVSITDQLPEGLAWSGMVMDKNPIELEALLRKGKSEAVRTLTYVAPGSWVGEDDTYTVENGTLKMQIGLVSPSEYYKITVKTSILDEAFATDKVETFQNVAEATVKIGSNTVGPQKLQAEKEVSHNLIKKEVVPFTDGNGESYYYHYNTNRVQWKIIINEKKLPIDNAVIWDTLPKGTSGVQMISAKRISSNGTEESGALVSGTNQIIFSAGTAQTITWNDTSTATTSEPMENLKFEFSMRTDAQYELVFSTYVNDDYRLTEFKSNEDTTLTNQVKLDGTINGKAIVDATASADNRFSPKPLLKSGTYKPLPVKGQTNLTYISYDDAGNRVTPDAEIAAAYFEWTVLINRTKADYLGVKITDEVEDVFELIPTSMVISTVELDDQGYVTEQSRQSIYQNPNPATPSPVAGRHPLTDFSLDERKFQFEIPDEYKDKTLELTFQTVLVDDAAAGMIKNQICAQGNGWSDETSWITDESAKSFKLSNYATAKGMILLQIFKNSQQANSNPIYLEGATFELQKMKNSTNAPTVLGNWEPDGAPKYKTTNAKGQVVFMLLKTETMYKLKETEAPHGYEKLEKDWYFVITDNHSENFPGEAEGVNGDRDFEIILPRDSFISETIRNSPYSSDTSENKLMIKKLGQNGQPLSGAKFELSYNRNVWTKESQADGTLTFEFLDPLPAGSYYELKETVVPSGYENGSRYRVYVTVDENNDYVVRLTDAGGAQSIAPGADGIYEMINIPIRKSGSFTKVDQNGEALKQQAVTFQIERRGDGGSVSGSDWTVDMNPTGVDYREYLPLPNVTSDADGIITLDNLYYGDYKLSEQPFGTPDSLIETVAEPVYIQVRSNGMYAKDSTGAYTISLANKTNLKVENKVKTASIQINKVAGDPVGDSGHTVTKPLKDISFVVKKAGDNRVFLNLKTDENGNFVQNSDGTYTDAVANPARKAALTVGNYTLEETATINGYQVYTAPIPFEVTPDNAGTVLTIGYDGKRSSITEGTAKASVKFYNLPKRGTLRLTKTDGNSAANLDGAVFLVYADKAGDQGKDPVGFVAQEKAGEPYVIAGGEQLRTIKEEFPSVVLTEQMAGVAAVSGNDDDGYGLIARTAAYWLKEIRAPYGYKPYNQLIRLSIEDPTNTITIDNNTDHSRFQVGKTVETLGQDLKTGGQESGRGFVFKVTGKDTAQGSQKPIQELQSLLIDGKPMAAADNAEALPDGIQVTTGTDGKFELSGLPVGVYRILEVGGPGFEGYQVSSERVVTIAQQQGRGQLEILFDERPTGESNPVLTFYNQWKRQDLRGIKKDQDGVPLAGAVFGLYSEDGSVQHRTTVSDGQGEIRFDSIPVGNYLLKELQAPEGYLISNPQGWNVVVSPEASEEIRLSDDLVNRVKRGSIAGRKLTGTGEPLAGAHIGLFFESTTSFREENLYQNRISVSAEDGSFLFEQVPYGTYRIAELKAPSGYSLNRNTSYIVGIQEDGSLVSEGIKEERLTGVSTEPEEIVIVNTKNKGGSSDGGGGGGTTPRPKDPTEPANPGPGVPPTEVEVPVIPELPLGLIPGEPNGQNKSLVPGDPIQLNIPFNPDNPVIDVPGLPPRIEIRNTDGHKVYDGSGSGVNIDGWVPGVYEIFLVDENGIPLGSMLLTIADDGTPLSFHLPKTGDSSMPVTVPFAVMFVSAVGIWAMRRRKKEEGV